jgi:hypothetical protein
MLAVSFLPQVLGFSADFWAGRLSPPNHRHAAAIGPPKSGPADHAPVIKHLPESS